MNDIAHRQKPLVEGTLVKFSEPRGQVMKHANHRTDVATSNHFAKINCRAVTYNNISFVFIVPTGLDRCRAKCSDTPRDVFGR